MIKINKIFKYDINLIEDNEESDIDQKLNWKVVNIFNYNEKLDFSKFLLKNVYIKYYSIFEKYKDCIIYKHEKLKNNLFSIFDVGIIIVWGLNLNEEIKLIKNINNILSIDIHYNELICDNYYYIKKNKEKVKLIRNYLFLDSNLIYNKIIISYIFAQDAFLDHSENEIEEYLVDSKKISFNMTNNKITNINKKEIFKKIGKIYWLLNRVMFKRGILDNPKLVYFKEYETIYNKVSYNLNINTRTQVLIKKIRMVIAFYDNLKIDYYFKKEVRLELIVLFLVITNVILYFFKLMIN